MRCRTERARLMSATKSPQLRCLFVMYVTHELHVGTMDAPKPCTSSRGKEERDLRAPSILWNHNSAGSSLRCLSRSHTFHTDILPGGPLFATDKPNQTEEYLPSKEYGRLAQPSRVKNKIYFGVFSGAFIIIVNNWDEVIFWKKKSAMTQTQLCFVRNQKAAHERVTETSLFEEDQARKQQPVRETHSNETES